MPLIHNQLFKQNLAQYRTWIKDTEPSSLYFRVYEFPDVMTCGKNSFLINGSPNLIHSTELKIEIIDSLGNTVFVNPIKNYLEGLARLVSIEIYENTPPGIATITILGQLATDINGNIPPEEFINSYNLMWQRQFVIDPSRLPSNRIRTYTTPSIKVTERLTPYRDEVKSVGSITSGTLEGITLNTLGDPVNPFYAIKLTNSPSTFVKNCENGIAMMNVNGTPFTSSITQVLNDSVVFLKDGFSINKEYVGFKTTDFKIEYTGSSGFTPTQYIRSNIDIEYNDLQTFSGQIYRSKVSVKSVDNTLITDYELIDDTIIEPLELLQEISMDTKELLNTGNITSQEIVDNHWTFGLISNIDMYTGD